MNKLPKVSMALRQMRAINQLSRTTISPTITHSIGVLKSEDKPQYRYIHTGISYSSAKSSPAPEKVVGDSTKYEFLAETRQLLNIVAKSLYSEKEVFVRELISNSSDAIEKLKYIQLSSNAQQTDANQVPYEIQIVANDMNNTLTIQDTGVGMGKEELIKNLGTIAHSGSKVCFSL